MRLCVCITVSTSLLLAGVLIVVAAEPFQPAPEDGVLLLVNGQIIKGKVTRGGDHYYVALSDGEIRLKASEVELFCKNLEDGYERKRVAMLISDATEHLELAQWCIQHQLFGCAARELAEAAQMEPRHPKIPVLERRLALAMADEATPRETPSVTKLSLSNDELDRMVRGMPEGVIETFNHTIQPLLLNNCTSSGCHGPASATNYSLLRIPLGRTPSRRLTLLNLHATLAQVNMPEPSQSALLTMSVKEHGGGRTAVFTSREVLQYRQLVQWAFRVSRAAVPADAQTPLATSLEKRPEPLLQSMRSPPAASTPPAPHVPAPPEKKPAPTNGYVPIDPFDPEVFNQQSSPK